MEIFIHTHTITQDYRDRWSTLPEGKYDLEKGDRVQMLYNPGIGSITVQKQDLTKISIAGFSGYILKHVATEK